LNNCRIYNSFIFNCNPVLNIKKNICQSIHPNYLITQLTKSTNQPINQSTNQPINQSTNQPINQLTNKLINQSTQSTQSTNQEHEAIQYPRYGTWKTGFIA